MRSPEGIEVQDRDYHFKTYPQCFVGHEAVDWLVAYLNISREDAVKVGQRLVRRRCIAHVLHEHSFEDKYLFYRFCSEFADLDFGQLVATMRSLEGVEVRDRDYHFKTYPQCFVGREAVDWLMAHLKISRDGALEIGQQLVEQQWITHVLHEHPFKDKYLFYQFCQDKLSGHIDT
ncbi:MAG: hypothetical protein F6J87_29090 [Spirulina sp. SIO3F2]|nr:hypothetical protein [Spirulina sp. SIO3F2]